LAYNASHQIIFTVRYQGNSSVAHTAVVHVMINDPVTPDFTFTVKGAKAPYVDLTGTFASTLKLPATTTSGNSTVLTLPIVVKNSGNVALPAGQTIDIAVYARTNDGHGGFINTLLTTLANQSVNALAAAASKTFTAHTTLPLGLATGSYTLVAEIDSSQKVTELNENNNEVVSASSIAVARGYLDLSGVFGTTSVTLPVTVQAGQTLSGYLPLLVSNTGNLKLPSNQYVYVNVVAVNDATLDETNLLVSAKFSVANLLGTTTLKPHISMPLNLDPGSYHLKAYLMPAPALAEADPGNDTVLVDALGQLRAITVV
jgi:hypothetical protein